MAATIDGGAGADVLLGGAGADSFVWDANDRRVDGGGGHDALMLVAGDDINFVTRATTCATSKRSGWTE